MSVKGFSPRRCYLIPFTMKLPPVRAFALLFALAASVVRGAEIPVLAKARAFLGGDVALESIRSIHYVGKILGPDPKDPKLQTSAAIEIIIQRPYQYKVTVTSDQVIDSTALDDYDAWNRQTAVGDPKSWRQTLQGPEQIKRLRANAWENISFFGDLTRVGGVVEDKGSADIGGVACEKVAFIHSPSIIYYRYFDQATGRLVFSETETGGTIREEGEIRVDGIRFPKALISLAKADGKEMTVKITFDRITLNEVFPASEFAVPPLQASSVSTPQPPVPVSK